MESCEKQWLLFIPDWGHALCSVPGKHCWQVWCFQIAPGFVEIFNIPKVDWRCHSKRDSWNVSSTNSTNHFRFQIYIFFLNLLSLWIIHFQFITFDSCFVFKDGSNFFSFSTQFPSQQGRLSNGDFERAPYAFNVSYDPIEVTGLIGWLGWWWGCWCLPDDLISIWWSSKKKLGGTKPPMNRWSTPWNCMGW